MLKKLRYAPGMKVCVLGAPSSFEAELAKASGITRASRLGRDLDLVQAYFTRKANLVRDMRKLEGALAPGGKLWLCYPKAGALGTDLDRDVIRTTVAKAGLEAVAIVALDSTWSALRCKSVR